MTKASRSRQQRRRTVTIFQDNVQTYLKICKKYKIRSDDTTMVLNAMIAVVGAALKQEEDAAALAEEAKQIAEDAKEAAAQEATSGVGAQA